MLGAGGNNAQDRAVEVAPQEWLPFQLPFAQRKRIVLLELGHRYKRSSKVSLDNIAEFTVALRHKDVIKASDRVQVKSEYSIVYPQDSGTGSNKESSTLKRKNYSQLVTLYGQGLGLSLETDLENDCISVKKVKNRSFADVEEDVRAGDQVTLTYIHCLFYISF